MSVSYDVFIGSFLEKITDRGLLTLESLDRDATVIGFMKRSINGFKNVCKYDLVTTSDDIVKEFYVDIPEHELIDIADIISEGMVVQWLKPYVYNQELLENSINTRDFSTYSPAELLMRVGNAYKVAKKDYINMIREYSYNSGDLTKLHI